MENKENNNATNFLHAIDIYALADIEKMLQVVDYNSPYSRLAVPIALTCFSLLDILGFLIRDIDHSKIVNEADVKSPLKETEKNLKASLNHFFSKEIKQNHVDHLINLYRHGLVHSFFPKNVGIHNSPEHHNFITSNGQMWNFNVHYFAKYLVERVREDINTFSTFIFKDNFLKNFILYENDCEKYFSNSVGSLPKSTKKTVEIIPTTVRQNPS